MSCMIVGIFRQHFIIIASLILHLQSSQFLYSFSIIRRYNFCRYYIVKHLVTHFLIFWKFFMKAELCVGQPFNAWYRLKGYTYLTELTGKNYRSNSMQQKFVKNRILAASDYCLHNQLKFHNEVIHQTGRKRTTASYASFNNFYGKI